MKENECVRKNTTKSDSVLKLFAPHNEQQTSTLSHNLFIQSSKPGYSIQTYPKVQPSLHLNGILGKGLVIKDPVVTSGDHSSVSATDQGHRPPLHSPI